MCCECGGKRGREVCIVLRVLEDRNLLQMRMGRDTGESLEKLIAFDGNISLRHANRPESSVFQIECTWRDGTRLRPVAINDRMQAGFG